MAEQTSTMPGAERLSKRNLWGYSMGGIGRDMVYQLINTALMTYILVTRGVDAKMVTVIGVIFLCCRIFDGCNDPLMGAIIERTRTKVGKFKPWMVIGMATNIIVILALFYVNLTGWDYVIFFAFMYLLWGITYTMNDISYWGMMPSLTSNPTDRNNISTLANIGAGVGAGLAIGATTLFTGGGSMQIGGNAITAYRVVATVICCIFAGCQLMTFFVVKEKPLPPLQPKKKGESNGLTKIFKVIFHNDQLLAVAGSMLLYNVGAAVLMLFSTYWVWIRYGYVGLLVTIFSLLTACSSVIIIFYPMLAKKFSRRKIVTISFITICIGYSLLLILGLSTGAAHLSAQNDFICYFFIAIAGAFAFFGQTLFYQVQTISIANTVEYNDYKTGSRDEGAIFSVRPFMAKMASAIGVGIQTLGLTILGITQLTNDVSNVERLGYQDTTGWYAAQNSEGLKNILGEVMTNKDVEVTNILSGADISISQWLLVFMSVIPLLFIIGAYIIYMTKYKIDEKSYEDMCAAIAERDAAKAAAGDDAEAEDTTLIDAATEDMPDNPLNLFGNAEFSAIEADKAEAAEAAEDDESIETAEPVDDNIPSGDEDNKD